MRILVDTGALIALLNKRDQFHLWTIRMISQMPPPFYTCEAVLTETHFLIANHFQSVQDLYALVDERGIICDFSYQEQYARVHHIMNKYRDLPASFADACLVSMAINKPGSQVFTLDRHFHIYRAGRKKNPVNHPLLNSAAEPQRGKLDIY